MTPLSKHIFNGDAKPGKKGLGRVGMETEFREQWPRGRKTRSPSEMMTKRSSVTLREPGLRKSKQ